MKSSSSKASALRDKLKSIQTQQTLKPGSVANLKTQPNNTSPAQLDANLENEILQKLKEPISTVKAVGSLGSHERRRSSSDRNSGTFNNKPYDNRNVRSERHNDRDNRRNDRPYDRAPHRDYERRPVEHDQYSPRNLRREDRPPSREFDRPPSRDYDRPPSREYDRPPSRDYDRNSPRDFRREERPTREYRRDERPPFRQQDRRDPPYHPEPRRYDDRDRPSMSRGNSSNVSPVDFKRDSPSYPAARRDSRDLKNDFNKRPISALQSPVDGTSFMQGDRRLKTVLVSQINTRANESDIFRYFDRIGKVREVKLIYDKSSQRSKGLAYVEFAFGDSIPKAIEMDGSIFQGGPLTVEKVADDAANDEYADILGQIVVSQLHSSVASDDLKDLFGEFGKIKSVFMSKDQNGQSSGKAFLTFENKLDAQTAIKEMEGFEFMGQHMVVTSQENNGDRPEQQQQVKRQRYDKKDASNRVMQMLASKVNHGTESRCLTFSNLFTKEINDADFADISEDVKLELDTFGKLLHFDLKKDEELVYCKYTSGEDAQLAFKKINGRFFDSKIVKASYINESIYADKYPKTSYQ